MNIKTPVVVSALGGEAYIYDHNDEMLAADMTVEEATEIARCINMHAELVNELREVLDWARVERAPLRQQEIDRIATLLAQFAAAQETKS